MKQPKPKKNWIQSAIKNPGALHKETGTPMGQKIPQSKLDAAAKKSPKMAKQVNLAKTLGKFNKKGK